HLVAGFGLGVLSIVLSRRARLGLSGIGLVVAATLLGGSQAPIGTLGGTRYLGLDWFLLNVLVLSMLFVPLERVFARLPAQRIFRPGWATDLAHFGVSHLLVQLTVVTRALAFVPLYVLGFSTAPVYAYLVFVSFHAIFVHANVRFRFGALERLVGTPKFHHWHHATAPVDKNFAIHLPVIDRMLGTYYLPEHFPPAYGIEPNPVPRRYAAQLVWPFRPR